MPPPFMRADAFENIVGLIILILWGVGRLVMSRNKPAPPPSPAAPPSEAQGPDDELRRLLEELSGGQPAAPAAPPPEPSSSPPPPVSVRPREAGPAHAPMRPPPLPERPASPSRPAPRHRRRPTVTAPSHLERARAVGQDDASLAVRSSPPLAPTVSPGAAPLKVAIFSAAPRAVLPTQSFGGMATLRGAVTHRDSPNARRIRQWLSSARTRRDAVVLAEVLGPPRALADH